MTGALALRGGQLARPVEDAPLAERVAVAFLGAYPEGNTRDAYRRDLTDWFRYCAEHDLDPLQVRRPHVDAYARDLERYGKSAATVARRLATMSSLYSYAVVEGVIPVAPTAHVRRPKLAAESLTTGLDRAEALRLLDQAGRAGPRDHALVCLLLLNGLRVTEVCAADVDQLDEERGHRVLAVTRKGGSRVLIPLAARTARAVDGHVAGRSSGPLLLANEGGRLRRTQATRILVRLARAAGIAKTISPHSLRHTAITLALDDGATVREVQVFAGHADPKTTMRYDRARRDLDGAVTYRLARVLAED
jgi:integrase/recombinase XerD